MVYVLSIHGNPLMPCKPAKARKLLRDGKATVVQRTPFTIKLGFECENQVQPVTLGVDAGSKTIGLSATTEESELYASEIALRTDIVELLATRSQFRRGRRNRKRRYRQPRFQNRKRGEGWLAPSIRQRIATHLQVVRNVHKILPISHIVIEVASFDIQKIQNPAIEAEQYQQGEQLGFWNVREYVLHRDGHKCRGKSGCHGKILNVHHLETRATGGDAPNNLITLCEDCHKAFHKGELTLNQRRGNSFRDAAFMGIMRWAFYNQLREQYPSVALTYGYLTKNTRIRNGLEKTHCTDARCISQHPQATPLPYYYQQKATRRHNRQIHKATIQKGGYRKANQAPKYVFGFQLFDKVLYEGQECFVFGRRTRGYFDVRTLDGERVGEPSYRKLIPLGKRKTMLTERKVKGGFLTRVNYHAAKATWLPETERKSSPG